MSSQECFCGSACSLISTLFSYLLPISLTCYFTVEFPFVASALACQKSSFTSFYALEIYFTMHVLWTLHNNRDTDAYRLISI